MAQSMIDVSEWQGAIDWRKVKEAGYHAVIRCGYGGNYEYQDDKYFAANVQGCEENGIPYGVYLYSYADSFTKANSEVDHALRMLEGYCGDNFVYPVYIDVEEPGIEHYYKEAAETFCSAMDLYGYESGVYASRSVYDTYLKNSQVINEHSLWIASWGVSSLDMSCDIWQYTNVGRVPGVSTDCDLNYCFIGTSGEIGGCEVNLGNAAKSDVIDFLVYKTLSNAYGTGEERKNQLGELYTDVQEKINKLLGV